MRRTLILDVVMAHTINENLLSKMADFKSEHPGVNCGTCHHCMPRPGSGPREMMKKQGGRLRGRFDLNFNQWRVTA